MEELESLKLLKDKKITEAYGMSALELPPFEEETIE